MDAKIAQRFEQAIREDGRYPAAAYGFVQYGLELTTRSVFGSTRAEGPRHVTGQQLCMGLRALASERWGLLAPAVLATWNIRRTRDFGEMVFLLIEVDMMNRRDSDRIEDFDDVYDFAEAFGSYEVPLDKFDEEH
jgi:uncharacterized repeat protein (TIGR04138 family)